MSDMRTKAGRKSTFWPTLINEIFVESQLCWQCQKP